MGTEQGEKNDSATKKESQNITFYKKIFITKKPTTTFSAKNHLKVEKFHFFLCFQWFLQKMKYTEVFCCKMQYRRTCRML